MTPDEIFDLATRVTEHDRWFAEMRSTIQQTMNLASSNARVIQSLCSLAAEDREERQEMLADIRGLQVENRRILDILLNNQQQDDQE